MVLVMSLHYSDQLACFVMRLAWADGVDFWIISPTDVPGEEQRFGAHSVEESCKGPG